MSAGRHRHIRENVQFERLVVAAAGRYVVELVVEEDLAEKGMGPGLGDGATGGVGQKVSEVVAEDSAVGLQGRRQIIPVQT